MTKNTLSFNQSKPVFVGIDVHLQSYSVVVLVGEDKPQRAHIPAAPEALVSFLRKRFEGASIRSVYEAGFSGFALHRFLRKQGIENIVVNPSAVPVSSWDRVKTDKRDAMKLATMLRAGALRAIHIPEEQEELDRELTRSRAQIVKDQSRIGVQIKAKLRKFGYLPYEETRPISERFLKELLSKKFPFPLQFALEKFAKRWKDLNKLRKEFEKEIENQISSIKRNEVYQSVPGVGVISSAVLIHELGDVSRFNNVRALYSYTGLTPSEFSSGPYVRKGHITRQGNARLRGVLVEVAWRAIRKDSSLKTIYERLKHRRGAKRAIVAIARHLVGRLRACVIKNESYQIAA